MILYINPDTKVLFSYKSDSASANSYFRIFVEKDTELQNYSFEKTVLI